MKLRFMSGGGTTAAPDNHGIHCQVSRSGRVTLKDPLDIIEEQLSAVLLTCDSVVSHEVCRVSRLNQTVNVVVSLPRPDPCFEPWLLLLLTSIVRLSS